MAKINFLYRGTKETGKLSIRLSHSKEIDFRVSTSIQSKKSYWFTRKSKNGKTKTVHLQLKDLPNNGLVEIKKHKSKLQEIETNILSSFINDHNKGIPITIDWLRNAVNQNTNILDSKEKIEEVVKAETLKTNANLLTTAIKNMFVKYATNPNELKKYKVTENLILNYQETINREIETKEVGQYFADLFKQWAFIDMKYSKSYINAQLKRIRKSVLYTYQNDEAEIVQISKTLTSFDLYKIEKKDKIVITLNYDEIDLIDKTIIEDERLQDAKKSILIGCETGLRYSDMNKLIDTNIKNVNGVNYWKFRTEKTDAIVQITITDRILYLIDKYGLPKTNYPSNGVKLNRDIKEVCKLSKIDNLTQGSKAKVLKINGKKVIRNIIEEHPKYNLITSRTFRRSFATNYYGKIDTSLIRAITGHATENQLRAYINNEDETNITRSKSQIDKFHNERKQAKNDIKLTVVKNASNQN